MFRKMRRKKQQLEQNECIEILKTQKRGVLSLNGDDGYPYGLPIDFWYDDKSGKICFHASKQGHKADAISRSDKASFCVYDEGYAREGEWALNIRSVIVFGRIKAVESTEEAERICRNLALKFTDDKQYIDDEISKHLKRVMCLELTPEHISGKIVNES